MARRRDQRGPGQSWPTPDQSIGSLEAGQPGGASSAGDDGRALRTLALIAVVVGLIALTTAACVLSYASVHAFALRADVSQSLARIYPYICDAMLVLAGCSVLALRGAGLISRVYAWLCFIVLLATLAAVSVAHEAGLNMPLRSAQVTVAVLPWALVLVAFGLLLALLRHARRRRLGQRTASPVDGVVVSPRAALEAPPLEPAAALEPAGPAGYEQAGFEPVAYEQAGFDHAYFDPVGSASVSSEPDAVELASGHGQADDEPVAQAETDRTAFDQAIDHDNPITHEVSPAPVEQPAEPSAAAPRVVRPTEMQLRARTQRQPVTTDTQAGTSGSRSADAPPALTPPVPETGGDSSGGDSSGGGEYTGDTIPRGELSPAPTSDPPAEAAGQGAPPELDRPRSSPTPPSG